MGLSRRKFISAGIVAAACAGLPLKSALAESRLDGRKVRKPMSPSPSPLTSSADRLNYYTKSTFDPYVNTVFRVQLAPSDIRELKLTVVGDYLTSLSRVDVTGNEPKTECFSLLLTMSPGKPFEQDTYFIEHDALGTFYLFVVPVSAQDKKGVSYYEAIIYRRESNEISYDSGVWETNRRLNTSSTRPTINDAQPTVTAVTPQLIWNPGLVYGGGITEGSAVESPAKRGNTKEEQEIFYFRPLPPDPEIVATRTRERIARVRRAAGKLTMAQAAPAIGGLKLGITTEQVLALFPGSKDDKEVLSSLSRPASRFGESSLTIKPGKYSSNSKFDRISQISLTLLDGRVSTLYVGYDGPVWENVDEFVAKFSEEKSLPTIDSWEAYAGMDTQLKTLKCQDFEVSLFAGGQNLEINYVHLRDLTAQRKLKERRAAAAAEKKLESKPQASEPSKERRERK
jgi:hypothetical protein